jgi:acyl-CoA thioesterase YciA
VVLRLRLSALEAVHMIETPRGALTVRISAMPADTNANGDIFGGWVLSRMDQAGGIAGVSAPRAASSPFPWRR